MAHTDRDSDRVFWRDHHRYNCPNAYRRVGRKWGDWTTKACDVCPRQPSTKYWCSTEGKGPWNRAERQTERARARQAIRECSDWDTLSIRYRRPYWD